MRLVASVLLAFITGSLTAAPGGSDHWAEYSHVYATVPNGTAVTVMAYIIVIADEALGPLGFRRDAPPIVSSGPEREFASFKAGGLAEATIAPGGCVVFSATNYDEDAAGLVKAAAAAIEASFRKSFGSSVMFFADATCSHAL